MTQNNTFALLTNGWQLAPAATPREEPKSDSDEPPTLAEVLAWLSGNPKNDGDAFELKQQILREDIKLPNKMGTPLFMANETEFQQILKADAQSHHLIEEANNTALTSATWHHQLMLMDYLRKRQMRASFRQNSTPRHGANVFSNPALSGAQQIRAYCRTLIQAPALRQA